MRITIEFTADKEVMLPIHYNHILQGFLYKNLSDKDYRSFLHHTGYMLENRQFKLFTFSRLLGQFRINGRDGNISFLPPFQLVVSSAVEQFITDLAETLIKSDDLFLGNNLVEIRSIHVHKGIEFADTVQIKMLSPVVAYSTVIEEDKKWTEFYSPWNEKFTPLARQNLLRKSEIIYGQIPGQTDFKIIPNGSREHDFAKIINYKNFIIKGYAGIYWLQGNPDLIKVSYDTGLGSKNSQGFGCWEVVR